MKATQMLHNLGQSIWLDNITRELLDNGTLNRYIKDLSVTGLTSNPTIFDHAITHSKSYDSEIRRLVGNGLSGEELFFELAVQDLTRAADLFAPIHERTASVDGWVSLEVSPLLAYDPKATVAEARALHKKANRRNLFIKIPGTKEGASAIEEAIFLGIPVNVTLLFTREHYLAAAEAYMRGLELSHRFSSAAGTRRQWIKYPTGIVTSSESPSAGKYTRHTASCSSRIAGSNWQVAARARNGCSLQALEPRIQRPPMSFI